MVATVKKTTRLQQVPKEWIEFLEIVEEAKPKIILEIGTAQGGSALCLSYFADTIITIDQYSHFNQETMLLIQKNCEFHFIRKSTEERKSIRKVENILDGRKADVLFIDGDHTYRGAKRDFMRFSKFVAPGGIVALHDIVNTKHHRKLGCKVFKFWEEIRDQHKTQEFLTTDWGGIGVITNFQPA